VQPDGRRVDSDVILVEVHGVGCTPNAYKNNCSVYMGRRLQYRISFLGSTTPRLRSPGNGPREPCKRLSAGAELGHCHQRQQAALRGQCSGIPSPCHHRTSFLSLLPSIALLATIPTPSKSNRLPRRHLYPLPNVEDDICIPRAISSTNNDLLNNIAPAPNNDVKPTHASSSRTHTTHGRA
jgi:hypothetical protein